MKITLIHGPTIEEQVVVELPDGSLAKMLEDKFPEITCRKAFLMYGISVEPDTWLRPETPLINGRCYYAIPLS